MLINDNIALYERVIGGGEGSAKKLVIMGRGSLTHFERSFLDDAAYNSKVAKSIFWEGAVGPHLRGKFGEVVFNPTIHNFPMG